MITISQKKANFLIYYQCWLAVVAVFIFFTNLDVYWQTAGILPLEPLHWIILFIGASTPIIFSFSSRKKFLSKGLLRWCFGYFAISLFYFWLFLSTPEAFQELRIRVLSITFLLLTLIVFSKYYIVQKVTRYAIMIAGLLATIINIYEFFNPLAFIAVNETGRSRVLHESEYIWFCLGSQFNFWRGFSKAKISSFFHFTNWYWSFSYILAWFAYWLDNSIIILISRNIIPRQQFFLWFVGLAMIVTAVVGITGNLFSLDSLQDMGLINNNVLGRLQEFGSPSNTDDDAALARIEVVKLAWHMFSEHPFIGNGIGSTSSLNVGALATHDISTHNMYLYFMADHGILGAFIYPLLIYAVTHPYQENNKYIILVFMAFYFIWGFFNHNIVVLRFYLMTFSLMATMNQTTQILNYKL